LVGHRDEIIERLRLLERAGLSQIFLNPPLDDFNYYVDDFSREIIEHI
jgi:hypothetical protein